MAADIIREAQLSNAARQKPTQDAYIQWCLTNAQPLQEPTSLVNYLASLYRDRQLTVSTLAAYRSAILDIFDDRASASASPQLKTFFTALQKRSIRPDITQPVDISPALTYLRTLGSNSVMPIEDLTRKLCWLLALCSFLRPSDIERVDLDASDWSSNPDRLLLTVVAPKEKRFGQRIRRQVTLRAHNDSKICPVAAFRAYVARHACQPCHESHPALPHVQLHFLIRKIRDNSKPIFAQRISKYIKSVMAHLPNGSNINGRALGSTRALVAGASIDEVVAHGNWALGIPLRPFIGCPPSITKISQL